jgi:hypothetical protein
MKTVVLFSFLAIAILQLGHAASPAYRLDEGIRYYESAKKDPAGNLEKAREILGALRETDPLAEAYYGCLCTIEAGIYADKKKLIKTMSLLKQGAAFMDEAVERAPDQSEIRFIRMVNSYDLSESSPVNRDRVMAEDVAWFKTRESRFDAKNRGIIRLYTGLHRLRTCKTNEAREAFSACIAISPGSEEAAEAERQLAKLSKRK